MNRKAFHLIRFRICPKIMYWREGVKRKEPKITNLVNGHVMMISSESASV